MESKLTKKQILVAVVTFIISNLVLMGIATGMLAIKLSGDIVGYVKDNADNAISIVGGIVFLTGIMFGYLVFEYREMLKRPSKIVELYLLLDISFVSSFLISFYINVNARPFAFFAIMCATLMPKKHAAFLNMINALLLFVLDINMNIVEIIASARAEVIWPYCCNLLITFCAGMLVIFASKGIKTRLQSIMLIFVIAIPAELLIIVMEVLFNASRDWLLLAYGALGSAFSLIMYMVMLPMFELAFSELTVFRLREITSPNAPLLKKLKNEAPGTYNHSVVVSQLVEACAIAIGEDGEIARAAALYHDVGKLKNPEMFTENQSDRNIHNELTPELSVNIIRSHTSDGVKIIKKYHLPEFLASAALQHHGTLPVKYFYIKALKMSDGDVPIKNFSYPGPVPESRIVAILMIADAAEAASRSLKDRSAANIEKLVGGLIEERMNLDQFVNCSITMRDLTIISRTIAQTLSGVYHSRIAYPKLKISSAK